MAITVPTKPPALRNRAWILAVALSVSILASQSGHGWMQRPLASIAAPLWSGSFVSSADSGDSSGGTSASTVGTPAGAPAAAQQHCDLGPLDGPIAEACHLFTDVCVDQQAAILHGDEYHPAEGREGKPMPALVPEKRWRHYIFVHKGTMVRDYHFGLPPIHFRPSSTAEPTNYLAYPVFSSCTVPIVYYSHYIKNPSHMFRDNAARLYGALNESSWREHAKLVLMTPEGLASPEFARDVTQPLSELQVETWAEFSSRLPSKNFRGGGFVPADVLPPPPPGAPRASFEGGPRRCFKNFLVCMDNFDIANWPLHAYGQHLARYHRGRLPAEAQVQLWRQPGEALQRRLGGTGKALLRRGQVAAGNSSASGSGGEVLSGQPPVLNIIFQKRDDRLLLNLPELLERCNTWRYSTPAGVEVRAKCWEVETPDLLAGIAAAQTADIFVGSHGANMANGWYMRPGSSVIELTMFEFDELQAHMQYPKRNMLDNRTEVQYYKLLNCDSREGRSWTPGEVEKKERAEGKPFNPTFWPKYRNLIVRWEALETALRAVVDTAGDMAQYKKRWEEGRWWWMSTADQIVPGGPSWYQTCKKAREEGLIH